MKNIMAVGLLMMLSLSVFAGPKGNGEIGSGSIDKLRELQDAPERIYNKLAKLGDATPAGYDLRCANSDKSIILSGNVWAGGEPLTLADLRKVSNANKTFETTSDPTENPEYNDIPETLPVVFNISDKAPSVLMAGQKIHFYEGDRCTNMFSDDRDCSELVLNVSKAENFKLVVAATSEEVSCDDKKQILTFDMAVGFSDKTSWRDNSVKTSLKCIAQAAAYDCAANKE